MFAQLREPAELYEGIPAGINVMFFPGSSASDLDLLRCLSLDSCKSKITLQDTVCDEEL